jgi:hypothetical protein
LCEYVQHLSIFDYIYVSASLENRVVEYVNGMITTDKFCMSRSAQLQLVSSRYDVYLQRQARTAQVPLLDEIPHRGGDYDTAAVAHPATNEAAPRRPAALGSGVSVPPAMDATTERVGTDQLDISTGGAA